MFHNHGKIDKTFSGKRQKQQDDENSNEKDDDAELPLEASLTQHVINLLLCSLEAGGGALNVCVQLVQHAALLLQFLVNLKPHLPNACHMRAKGIQVVILPPAAAPAAVARSLSRCGTAARLWRCKLTM